MRAKLIAALLVALALGVANAAAAGETVRCEVLAIEATNNGTGIDPALSAVLKENASVLQRQPFSAFNSFRLASHKSYELALGVPTKLSLPTPFVGSLRFNSQRDGKLDLTLDIERTGSKPVVINGTASPGTPLFAAGFASSGGTWIFGVLCDKPRSASSGVVLH